jgi:hypothetical protein
MAPKSFTLNMNEIQSLLNDKKLKINKMFLFLIVYADYNEIIKPHPP